MYGTITPRNADGTLGQSRTIGTAPVIPKRTMDNIAALFAQYLLDSERKEVTNETAEKGNGSAAACGPGLRHAGGL